MKHPEDYKWASGIPLAFLLLLIWETLSRTAIVDPTILPPPSTVAYRTAHVLTLRSFWGDLCTTSFRFLWGYLTGCLIAIPLGIALGMGRRAYRIGGAT